MKLVAVTSCPTGIAHSQMAAENLETTAEGLGHDIKVEVQGAMGAENELTDDDIAAADAAIITADTAVSTDRFRAKPLIKGTVKDGVNNAEELIERAVERAEAGDTGVVEVGGDEGDAESADADAAASVDASSDEPPEQLGGDPSKGLFARLRRLFS